MRMAALQDANSNIAKRVNVYRLFSFATFAPNRRMIAKGRSPRIVAIQFKRTGRNGSQLCFSLAATVYRSREKDVSMLATACSELRITFRIDEAMCRAKLSLR